MVAIQGTAVEQQQQYPLLYLYSPFLHMHVCLFVYVSVLGVRLTALIRFIPCLSHLSEMEFFFVSP